VAEIQPTSDVRTCVSEGIPDAWTPTILSNSTLILQQQFISK